MNQKGLRFSHQLVAISFAVWASNAVADPNLKILSPADGAQLKINESVDVVYDINPNPGGDHSHIYLDHIEAGILRKKKATFTLSPLPAGKHEICLKVVNKAHAPIGQDTCIMVTSQ